MPRDDISWMEVYDCDESLLAAVRLCGARQRARESSWRAALPEDERRA